MTVKLCLLKSGEDVITDIQELTPPDSKRTIGYLFKNPCIVKLVGQPISEEEDAPIGFKIRLQPWMPLSKSKDIPVVMDWVVSIVEPVEDLKSTYENALSDEQALNGEENELELEDPEDLGIDEQPDADNAD